MTKITAGLGKLNVGDLLRSLFVAALSPVFPIVMDSINAGNFDINWRHIWMISAGSAVGYLLKNMLTPSQIVITDPIKVQAAKDGQTAIKL